MDIKTTPYTVIKTHKNIIVVFYDVFFKCIQIAKLAEECVYSPSRLECIIYSQDMH